MNNFRFLSNIIVVRHFTQNLSDSNKAGTSQATPLAWAKKKGRAEIEERLINTGLAKQVSSCF